MKKRKENSSIFSHGFYKTKKSQTEESSAAGTYALSVAYPGDGFYHLPSTATAAFTILPRPTRLSVPFAVALPTATARVVVTLTDDLGRPLRGQVSEPKTVYVDLVGTGTATTLASSLLSGTTVAFSFPCEYHVEEIA